MGKSYFKKSFSWLVGGILFLVFGVSMLNTGIFEIQAHAGVKNWQTTLATLKTVDVKPYFFKNKRLGDQILATYTYSFSEKEYIGTRVAIDPAFAGDAVTLAKLRDNLKKAMADNQPVEVFVNPAAPKESILVKQNPIKAYLYTSFGGTLFLLGIIFLIIFGNYALKAQKAKEREKLFPEKPWKINEAWKSFKQKSEPAWRKLLPLVAFCVFWTIVSLVITLTLLFLPDRGIEVISLIAFLIIFNLALIMMCKKRIKGERWADSVELEASAYPVTPGKPWKFKITVDNPIDIEIVSGLRILVKFYRSFSVGGIEEATNTSSFTGGNVYSEEFENDGNSCFDVPCDIKVEENQITFSGEIRLPDNAEPSREDDIGFDRWCLNLVFSRPDKEYIESFEIPVYDKKDFEQQELNPGF
jgi:hypothetical protein